MRARLHSSNNGETITERSVVAVNRYKKHHNQYGHTVFNFSSLNVNLSDFFSESRRIIHSLFEIERVVKRTAMFHCSLGGARQGEKFRAVDLPLITPNGVFGIRIFRWTAFFQTLGAQQCDGRQVKITCTSSRMGQPPPHTTTT